MSTLLISLTLTWTDVFMAIGSFFEWIFRGMRVLGQGPNVIIGSLIIFILAYWMMRISKYRKEAQRNGTIE